MYLIFFLRNFISAVSVVCCYFYITVHISVLYVNIVMAIVLLNCISVLFLIFLFNTLIILYIWLNLHHFIAKSIFKYRTLISCIIKLLVQWSLAYLICLTLISRINITTFQCNTHYMCALRLGNARLMN